MITVPPRNTSKLEGGKVEFICEAKALPANITHRWYHNGVDITQLSWLESRSLIRKDGLLFINPLTAEDSGLYTCEVSNGIGNPDSASAYLSVECKFIYLIMKGSICFPLVLKEIIAFRNIKFDTEINLMEDSMHLETEILKFKLNKFLIAFKPMKHGKKYQLLVVVYFLCSNCIIDEEL